MSWVAWCVFSSSIAHVTPTGTVTTCSKPFVGKSSTSALSGKTYFAPSGYRQSSLAK